VAPPAGRAHRPGAETVTVDNVTPQLPITLARRFYRGEKVYHHDDVTTFWQVTCQSRRWTRTVTASDILGRGPAGRTRPERLIEAAVVHWGNVPNYYQASSV
jgi:hypothetical protein